MFKRFAETQTNAAVESILTSVSDALQGELEALRAEIDARLVALKPAGARPERVVLVEGLVEELAGAAAREAEEAALLAKGEAARAAEEQLAAAQVAAREQHERERAENDALRRTIDELRSHADAVAVAAQTEVSAIRAELAAARAELHERTSCLEAAERRVLSVEIAHAQVQDALDASQVQLACVTGERTVLAEQLALRCSDDPLARLRRSLRAFAGLTDTADLLETFIAQFAQEFDRVALFTVRENQLQGSRSVGIEPTRDVIDLVIPLTVESPLTRAASTATTIFAEHGPDSPPTALLGPQACCVVAIPLVTEEQVVAVAYAEMARDVPETSRLASLQIAETLVEHLMQALLRVRPPLSDPDVDAQAPERDTADLPDISDGAPLASPPSESSPTRAVDRVRVPESFEVQIDGAAAWLVDISRLGAQVLCSRPLRPNHQVRMLLPQGDRVVPCQGRVVWAVFEMLPAGGRYRAGLQFTNVDTHAVNTFINEQIATNLRASVATEA